MRNLSHFTAEERDWLSAFDPSVLNPEELRTLVMARRLLNDLAEAGSIRAEG